MNPVEVTIGRDEEAQLRINDEYASPIHAKLLIYPDQTVTIQDCGSTNGTYVDFVRVEASPVPIGPGTAIRIGRTRTDGWTLLLLAVRSVHAQRRAIGAQP